MSVTLLFKTPLPVFVTHIERDRKKKEWPNVQLFDWKRSSVEDVVPPRRGFTIASSNGRPLMMMDAAVVENHGIVPGDIPTSDLGPHLQAPLSP